MGQIVMLILGLAVAIVPIVGFLLIVWWLDRYEREPLWMVIATFFWGAVGGALLAIVFSIILDSSLSLVLEGNMKEAAGPVLVAPFVEELTKGCILVLLLRHRLFDNATDGFVYGSATGLGFAMTENFLYFSMSAISGSPGTFLMTVFLRTVFSAPLHAMASGMFGAALGLAKFQRLWVLKPVIPFVGLAMAMGLHFSWNFLATAGEMTGKASPMIAAFVGLPAVMVLFLVAFQVSLLHESWIIGRELKEEAEKGILPPSYVPILQTWLRRIWRGWLPPTIPHHHFIALCTKLAFRKHQAARCPKADRYDYQEEVRVLRQELRALIEKASAREG